MFKRLASFGFLAIGLCATAAGSAVAGWTYWNELGYFR
jgi:hypothetical protein